MKNQRISGRYPLVSRFTLLVLLPLSVAAACYWASLKQALPAEGATQLTEGVSAPVTVRRDRHGVVHIQARNEGDAFFAVGYAQAQDRLWQLEMQRRMVRGTLSEILGRESVDADIWFRTLGLHASARSAWTALSPAARASLSAYTAGVNAAMAGTRTLPVEFAMLGAKPEPWTEIDSLAWIKMFALNLSGNYRREIDRYLVDARLSPRKAAMFFPGQPAGGARPAVASGPDTAALLAFADTQDRVERQLHFAAPGTGSNAWAVAGRHTADGGAILANDPHLSLQIPSLWYVVSVDTPTLKFAGMSLVGLPLVIFGRNDHIAWGGTNMMADTQDLFLERPDPSGSYYDAGGALRPFATRLETIQVRADFPSRWRRPYAPIKLAVRSSERGPLISDVYKVFDAPVSLRWTALDPDDTSYEAFYLLNHARRWEQFKAALGHHVAPALNMLYADREGNIGYLGAGRIPVRRQGDGTRPVPGWDPAHGWGAVVPPDRWPQAYNPPSGYLVSANQRPVDAAYPYFISHDWASPARARRIEQLLRVQIGAARRFTPEDMARIQGDTVDLDAAAMMRVLRARLPAHADAAQAAARLRGWNGDMRADSQAAALFNGWMRHLREELFSASLSGTWNSATGASLLRRLGDGVRLEQLAAIIEHDADGWCVQAAGSPAGDCGRLLAVSLDKALTELHQLKGDWSTESWRWGAVQKTIYRHAPMSRIKPLDRMFERRIANGGSASTINVAGFEFVATEGYRQTFGAGFRQIIGLAPGSTRHLYMNSTGQSGNIMSPHYDDMVEPFRNVRYVDLDDNVSTTEAAR